MSYVKSSVLMQRDGKYLATITMSGWFWNYDETKLCDTLTDATKWLLSKRCYKQNIDMYLERKKTERENVSQTRKELQLKVL